MWLLLPAGGALALFAWLLTLHPSAAGRTYVAYGGMYIAIALVWLWAVNGVAPSRWDLAGATVALIGMAIIAIHLLDEGRFSSMTEIAAAEGIDLGQASKMSRLAQLAPDLIEAIALGRLEVDVSQLPRGKLSASWLAQREALVAGSR